MLVAVVVNTHMQTGLFRKLQGNTLWKTHVSLVFSTELESECKNDSYVYGERPVCEILLTASFNAATVPLNL